MCRLISWGYDTEDNIIKKPLHTILSRYKWFKKLKEEELKNEMNILSQLYCPLMKGAYKTKRKK
ncbi:MAG TPA: hypothetical protein P5513_05840 [Candidatus Diapherotrites archaeon]|nr:hypothetical protein [Candidatus Diapherotrites archaeon]